MIPQEKKEVSIIIPTYNEEKDISNCLKSLEKQSFRNFEVILVDDGSTDKTKNIVKKFEKVRLIEGEHEGPGISRNIGAKSAIGGILVFVDADMTFDKDYIRNLIKPLLEDEKKKIVGTTHDYESATNTENIWSRCWGKIRITKDYVENPAVFRAIRKKKFLELGGFDSKYGYADDQTLWLKYKIKPIYAKNAICYHKNPESLKEIFKQARWIGASVESKLFEVQVIRYLIPPVMIILFPVAIPLLAAKRCIQNKDIRIFFPWMLIFATVKYFGTVYGIFRKIYLGKNVR